MKVVYYIRYRYIPVDLMFTPMYLIPIEHTQVEAMEKANEYDLQVAVSKSLENLNYFPEHIRIESSESCDTQRKI